MMDGVPSLLISLLFFLWIVSYPRSVFFLWMDGVLSWSRHQNCKRIGVVQLLIMILKFTHRYSSTWCRKDKSWSLAPELQEDWIGTKDEIGSFNSSHLYLYLVSPLVPREMSQHQNCKRCPSTSLYEFKCV